jgi:hypothetical protein
LFGKTLRHNIIIVAFISSMVVLVLVFLPKIVYTIGAKDMDIAEQSRLIQEHIKTSMEAVQLQNMMSERTVMPFEQEEHDASEATEEPIIDADCLVARGSLTEGYDGQMQEGDVSAKNASISQSVSLAKPTLSNDAPVPGMETSNASA